ncbi:CU044_2847 family protein [Nonomuraea sp. NPDC059194]|uniref:CU044_2847 family protein n=1 Tax=Nonomuraea sp. NPDC059194 TaxID=3346764 RepID=UPI0036926E02
MTNVVHYRVDESTTVAFEIDPPTRFQDASSDQVLGTIREAVEPAVQAARVVLEKIKESRPAEVQVTFGVKVSGTANWLVAKTATEGNFEVTLTWKPGEVP